MQVEHHPFTLEFPELKPTIHALKQENHHFSRLLDEHTAVDKSIVRVEDGIDAVSDEKLHAMKQNRLKLKDELFSIANAARTISS